MHQFTDHIQLDDTSQMQTTRDGYLVASPRVARIGVQLYSGAEMGRPDKEVVRVCRPDGEVFSNDALKTFAHRPITNGHPIDMVTSRNWCQVSIGHSGGEVARDGDFIRVPLVLMDEAAIAEVRAGKAELSVGYTADIRWGEGKTPQGEAYDAVQANIRANHIALVDAARGGPQLRIGDAGFTDAERSHAMRLYEIEHAWCRDSRPPFEQWLAARKAQQAVADEARQKLQAGIADTAMVTDAQKARAEYIDRLTNSWRMG